MRTRRFLFWMVLAGLALRLAVLVWLYRGPQYAILAQFAFPSEMANVARAIASGEGLSSPFGAPTGPTALVAPVYPYLLAGVFRILGVLTMRSAVAILTLNSLFSALTCIPIFFLARRAFGGAASYAAAAAWMCFPYALFVPVNWLWETSLATLLLTVLVLLAMHLENSPSLRGWLGFGALWGLAALTSPVILAVLPLLAGWLCYRLRRKGTSWVGPAAASALVLMVCVAPWFVRNDRTFGRFVPFRSGFPLELRVGNSPETDVQWRSWLHPRESLGELHKYERLGEMAYMAEKRREALDFIAAHPGIFAWLTLKRILYVWTGVWSLSPRYLLAQPLDAVSIPISTVLTLLALAGLRRAFRAGNPAAWPLALTIFAVPLVYYITHADLRYRHPMDPFLLILASYAVVDYSQRRGAPVRAY